MQARGILGRFAIGVAALVGLMAGSLASPAIAQTNNLQKLSAQWVQWALSLPTPVNPMEDETGEDCMVGQRDDVWLLAGGFSGGTFNRECAVPAGKELFLPIFNSFGIDTPGICGQAGSLSVAELRSGAAGVVDSATIVSVTLDGTPVKNVPRVQSTVFEISLPEVNVFDAPCESFGDVRAGVYSPAVADGYYVRLKPLPVGQHTLKFRTELFESGGSIPQDITYTLNVTPVILK